MRIELKVIPGAKQNGIVGWHGDRLKVRVTAPAEKGKANDAVIALLADALNIAKSNISILSGHGAREKTVEVSGVSERELGLLIQR